MFKWLEKSLAFVAMSCAVVACGLPILIFGVVLFKGLPAISWDFLTEPMRQGGAAGGIVHHLTGTLILLGTALLFSGPLGLGFALLTQFYLPASKLREALTLFLYALNGMPSILIGLFGFGFFVHGLGFGKSWLIGGIVLGFMILPLVALSLCERIAAIPQKYHNAAAALGLKKSAIVWSVILPQSWSGWVTGTLLGLARAAGETAPIMFTAAIFSGLAWPSGVKESPVLALPYHIFVMAQDSLNPAATEKLWGSALVLLALVCALSLLTIPLRLRVQRGKPHA